MVQSAPSLRGVLIGLGVAAVVAALVIGIFVHLASESKSELSGSLTIDDAELTPVRCRSGVIDDDATAPERPRFHGVDLLPAGEGRSVRVLDDPTEGELVLVRDPDAAPRRIDRDACERFEVELRETDEMINEVWGMEGSVDLACPGVSGRIEFAHCYGGR